MSEDAELTLIVLDLPTQRFVILSRPRCELRTEVSCRDPVTRGERELAIGRLARPRGA